MNIRERISPSSDICVHVFDAQYAGVHYFGMEHDVPTLLRKMMELVPGKQSGLAKRLSSAGTPISQPQISRWLKGQEPARPNYDRIIKVAEQLGVLGDLRSEDIAHEIDCGTAKTVKIKGYVGAGAEAHFYAVADDAFEEAPAMHGSSDQTIALQIRGKSWGPAMDSWLVFYDDVRSPVTPDMFGVACVVGLSDDRILLKVIKSNGRGGFDLHANSTTEEVITDAQIEWAAKVIGMRPR
jgi:hypothetical protein